MKDYLADPSGENLIALGEDRNRLLLDYLAEGGKERYSCEGKVAWVVDTVAVFAKVTRDYYSSVASEDKDVMDSIEKAIGQSVSPIVSDRLCSVSPFRCIASASLPRRFGVRAHQ